MGFTIGVYRCGYLYARQDYRRGLTYVAIAYLSRNPKRRAPPSHSALSQKRLQGASPERFRIDPSSDRVSTEYAAAAVFYMLQTKEIFHSSLRRRNLRVCLERLFENFDTLWRFSRTRKLVNYLSAARLSGHRNFRTVSEDA